MGLSIKIFKASFLVMEYSTLLPQHYLSIFQYVAWENVVLIISAQVGIWPIVGFAPARHW
jgi:hypothetical protein